ncbi:MAG: hypothetical protein R3C18_08335 [Planctomycetaceae bacterium]
MLSDVQTVGFDQLLELEGSEGRVFTDVQKWAEIRRRVLTGEISKRGACREYDLHWETLQKILTHAESPGYRRTKPKQRHTIHTTTTQSTQAEEAARIALAKATQENLEADCMVAPEATATQVQTAKGSHSKVWNPEAASVVKFFQRLVKL